MIDKNDAPEGYIAVKDVEAGQCEGCAFCSEIGCINDDNICGCHSTARLDKTTVIFIKKPIVEETPNSEERKLRDDFAKIILNNLGENMNMMSSKELATYIYSVVDTLMAKRNENNKGDIE